MPDPLHPQTTPWVGMTKETHTMSDGTTTVVAHWFHRSVHHCDLRACLTDEPQGRHLSISFRDQAGNYSRYPTWDEIAHARYELLPADLDFVMHLPPPGEYVALHPTTFHLHEFPEHDGGVLTDRQALDEINLLLSAPEWPGASGMEDIAEIVNATGRSEVPNAPEWPSH